ncbi:putative pentatricopeptide repeat-containing protein At1g03510 [Vicia villosa]|uniref:putative pentatricopeptide repeat-containing protein At1g03510 n=1 Tax=Vicia villosa TaxID=3911 RepID=UPI00273BFD19|nr:putative pentatricopeptide repeat-containing protein At1g03510 [Vicia villosa]
MASSSFYSSHHQRLLSMTKLITSHVNQSRHKQALSIFHHIHTTLPIPLDPHVFTLILKSCTALHLPLLATSIHSHLIKTSFLTSNHFLSSSLINFYGHCISLNSARKLFEETPQPNVVVWNSIIALYSRSQHITSAINLFHLMNVPPNESTFNPIIAALSSSLSPNQNNASFQAVNFYRKMIELKLKPSLITLLALLRASVLTAALNLIKEIHGYGIRNDIDSDPQLSSGLIEAYGRCGCLTNSRIVFMRMRECDRDVVVWSSLISACALHGEAREALEIFREMEVSGVKPDGITFLGVLKACSHAGLDDEALGCFMRMDRDYGVEPNSEHYSCLVDVLSRAGRLYEAYEVIKGMPVKVTAKAWGALLGACRNYGELGLAEIAARALAEIEPDNAANYVLLAKIYASVGRQEEADRMIRGMKEKGVKTTGGSSWVVYSESRD